MSSTQRVLATVMVAAAAIGLSGTSAAAQEGTSSDADPAAGEVVQRRSLASEVCEAMVATAVETITKAPLVEPQAGRWRGRRYVCDYRLGSGPLRLTVDYSQTLDASRAGFERRRDAVRRRTELYGIGGEAFQDRRSKTIVSRKDNFVLTVDPSRLDAPASGRDIVALAATRAVFDCW